MPKTALIAESNKMFTTVLTDVLTFLGFTVVATTSEKAEMFELANQLHPNLLLFDLGLSENGAAGLPDLNALKRSTPGLKILVLGFSEVAAEFSKVITDCGLDGFWNKSDSRNEFIQKLNGLFSEASSPP